MLKAVLKQAACVAPIAFVAGTGVAEARGANPCDPLTYGARGDGVTDNTTAIQSAINACSAAGGGFVPLSGGVFLTYPIQLKNNVVLQVNAGATLRANIADRRRYVWAFVGYTFNQNVGNAAVPQDAGASEALITAYNVSNVGITGAGTIDGQGGATNGQPGDVSWWAQANSTKTDISAAGSGVTNFTQLAAYAQTHSTVGPAGTYASYGAVPTSNGLPRPWLVEFYNANHVAVSGITLTNSPMWHMGLRYSTDATVTNYTVNTDPTSPNTDGIDIVSSNGVSLSNAHISDGDDNIAIKSGFPGFNTPATPATNIVVSNSYLGSGHGFSIGSEADNGVNGLRASGITWYGTQYGFRIKSGRDRGSQIHDIALQNLTMTDVQYPIYFTDYYTGQPKAGADTSVNQPTTATTPYVHDVSISNLTATNDANATAATSMEIVGLPESPIYNIQLSNISVAGNSTAGAGKASNAKGIELRNIAASTFTNVTITNVPTPFILDEHVSVAAGPGSTSPSAALSSP